MPRPLRDTNPSTFHLLSIRTDNARLEMIPSGSLNELLGGIVGRYQEQYCVEIFAYCFLGDHFHILARGPQNSIWLFAENINREIARRVNRNHGISGHFWSRRYDDLKVITEDDLEKAFQYVITNPTHHGLVNHPRAWPGLCSYWQALNEKALAYRFTHYSRFHLAKQRALRRGTVVDIKHYQTVHKLVLSPLPRLAGLSKEQRRAKIVAIIEDKVQAIHEERSREGKTSFLGRKAVTRIKRGSIPMQVKRSRRPPCYTFSPEERKRYRTAYKAKRGWYDTSSTAYRGGDFSAEFPPYTLPPPLHRPSGHQLGTKVPLLVL